MNILDAYNLSQSQFRLHNNIIITFNHNEDVIYIFKDMFHKNKIWIKYSNLKLQIHQGFYMDDTDQFKINNSFIGAITIIKKSEMFNYIVIDDYTFLKLNEYGKLKFL